MLPAVRKNAGTNLFNFKIMGEKSLRKGTQKALLMQAIEQQKEKKSHTRFVPAVKTAGGAFLRRRRQLPYAGQGFW